MTTKKSRPWNPLITPYERNWFDLQTRQDFPGHDAEVEAEQQIVRLAQRKLQKAEQKLRLAIERRGRILKPSNGPIVCAQRGAPTPTRRDAFLRVRHR